MKSSESLTKREMVRSILRDHPKYTPVEVNRAMTLIYNSSLASGWLQIYCREESRKLEKLHNAAENDHDS